VPVRRPGLVA